VLDGAGHVVTANERARALLAGGTPSSQDSPERLEIASFPLAGFGDGLRLVLLDPRDVRQDRPELASQVERLGYLAGGIAQALDARLALMEAIAVDLSASASGQREQILQSVALLRTCLLRSHQLLDQLLPHAGTRRTRNCRSL